MMKITIGELRSVLRENCSLLEAKCPLCGDPDAYHGLTTIECPNERCSKFSQRQHDDVHGAKVDDLHKPYFELLEQVFNDPKPSSSRVPMRLYNMMMSAAYRPDSPYPQSGELGKDLANDVLNKIDALYDSYVRGNDGSQSYELLKDDLHYSLDEFLQKFKPEER